MVLAPRVNELREEVTFQTKTRTPDLGGGGSTSWGAITTDPTPRAMVRPVRGREDTSEGQVETAQTYLIIVRFREDITTAHKVVWRGTELNIRSVSDRVGDRRHITIEAEKPGKE